MPPRTISAIISFMMAQKPYRKTLCFFYILILLLWGVCSGASSVSEVSAALCAGQECYVNHNSVIPHSVNHGSVITSSARHLPAQEYLSVRDLGTTETLAAAGSRSTRLLSKSIRQLASHLFPGNTSAGLHTLCGLFLAREIPAHSPCGILITNYIHLKDGQKSSSFFTRFTLA